MNTLQKNIVEISEEVINRLGFILVDTVFRGDERNRIIEIFADGENGITIDDCAGISREIGKIIEEKELISSKYRLEVSSPGIDRPLKFIQQYKKNINRKFEISFTNNEGNETNLKNAKLVRIENEDLVFEADKKEITINFNNIKKATVLISF